jgi:hypothetical protein
MAPLISPFPPISRLLLGLVSTVQNTPSRVSAAPGVPAAGPRSLRWRGRSPQQRSVLLARATEDVMDGAEGSKIEYVCLRSEAPAV